MTAYSAESPEPMEVGRYLRIARRRWFVLLVATAVTTVLTLAFVLPQEAYYRSSGTYLITPRTDEADRLDAFDTLSRGLSISATYASIARSEAIRQRAETQLGDPDVLGEMSVSAEPVTGTNLVEISARGQDPDLAQSLAEAIGTETIVYLEEIGDSFQLEPLDPPDTPGSPLSARKKLTVGLGVIVGLLLGMGVAVMLENMGAPIWPKPRRLRKEQRAAQSGSEANGVSMPADEGAASVAPNGRSQSTPPADQSASVPGEQTSEFDDVDTETMSIEPFEVIDSDTRLFTTAIVGVRLQEELARAERGGPGFSFSVLRLSQRPPVDDTDREQGEQLRPPDAATLLSVATMMRDSRLRTDDTVGCIDDGVFAVLQPDCGIIAARRLLAEWRTSITSMLTAGQNDESSTVPWLVTKVCEYREGRFIGDGSAIALARRLAGLHGSDDPEEFLHRSRDAHGS